LEVSLIHPLFENILPLLHAFLSAFIFARLLILQYIRRQPSQNETPVTGNSFSKGFFIA